jgi:hypothetical protein
MREELARPPHLAASFGRPWSIGDLLDASCGEGQAEIGPGPAAPASPVRFSGEGAVRRPGPALGASAGSPSRQPRG